MNTLTAPVIDEDIISVTVTAPVSPVLTAQRTVSADKYISSSTGRKVRADIADDIAAQFEALTGEALGYGRDQINYSYLVLGGRMFQTTGSLTVAPDVDSASDLGEVL